MTLKTLYYSINFFRFIILLIIFGFYSFSSKKESVPNKWNDNIEFIYDYSDPLVSTYTVFRIQGDTLYFKQKQMLVEEENYKIKVSYEELDALLHELKNNKIINIKPTKSKMPIVDEPILRMSLTNTKTKKEIFNVNNTENKIIARDDIAKIAKILRLVQTIQNNNILKK